MSLLVLVPLPTSLTSPSPTGCVEQTTGVRHGSPVQISPQENLLPEYSWLIASTSHLFWIYHTVQPQALLLQHVYSLQSCLTLCNPKDCSPPCSSARGILQAWILEWAAIPFSRGSSRPRDQTQVSCIAGRFFIVWATRDTVRILGPDYSWLEWILLMVAIIQVQGLLLLKANPAAAIDCLDCFCLIQSSYDLWCFIELSTFSHIIY